MKLSKKHLITFSGLLFSLILFSQITITENFETGLPGSASSSETTYNLNSGSWRITSAYVKADNGSNRLAMNTSGYAITPSLNKPVSLSFTHRGSGSGKILTVEKSTNNGSNWTVIGTATVSSSSTYAQSNMSIGEAGTQGVLIRFTCGSSTIYLDDVTIQCSTMGDEPNEQSSLTPVDVTGTSAIIKITKADGEGRILTYSKDTATNWSPSDGIVYTNLPKEIDENVFACYSGNADSIKVTGLSPGENYHFTIFEYNGTGSNTNYKNQDPGILTLTTKEEPGIVLSSSSINFGSVKTGNSAKRILTVSGKYLEPANGKMNIKVDEGFKISTNSLDGYADSLEIVYNEKTLLPTSIYIQFNPDKLFTYTKLLNINAGQTSVECLLTGIGSNTDSKVYYISPDGDDTAEGTFDSPWYNLQKAVDAVVPGDTILVRGGTYYPNMKKDGSKTTVRLSTSGTSEKKITIKNFPDEWPIINFKDQPKKVSVRGIQLDGNWWHIYGLHITQAGDNGIKLEGNHNIIERCTFSYNDDTGLQLGFGHVFSDTHPGVSSNDGSYCSYNDIVDCDSYLNCDADNFGSDADGFACKMHNGKGNRFIRCRAWDNADDAWDLFETDYPVYIIECWAWGSGRASNFSWVDATGSFQGNGNAIKMGGNGTGGSSKGKHEAWNSIAFNCNKTGSVKGFDQNSHSDGEKLVNCLAFGNGYDFMFENAGPSREYYNNICFGSIEIAAGGMESNNAMLSTSDKAWTNVMRTFGYSDFVSLSEEDAKAARGIDGSLPKKFGRLKSGSNLIDKGLDLTPPYTSEFSFLKQDIYGLSRDLGPYELQEGEIKTDIQLLMQNKPVFDFKVKSGGIHGELTLCYSVQNSDEISIDLFDLQGKKISALLKQNAESGIEYQIPVQINRKGIFICTLRTKNQSKTVKISL